MVTFLLILLSLLAGGIIGNIFGSQIKKHIYTALGIPFFTVTLSRIRGETLSIGVDAQFNSLFIYELERMYRARGDDKIINPMSPDEEKVAIYLYDVIANIAEEYLPVEGGLEELDEGVPMLGFRGGEEVKQVVDLGKPGQNSNVDFVR